MKIAVISGYPLVIRGLISIFSGQENFQLCKEATTMAEALIILEKERPDIAIVEAKLGSRSGLDLILEARQQGIETKFILLGLYENKEFLLKAIKVRVEGHILREAYPEEILYAVDQVSKGKKYYDSDLIEYLNRQEPEKQISGLTIREKQILGALGKGLSNREIAKELFVTEHTVKKHVSQILAKLKLHDRVQAAIFANSKDLIS